MWGLICRFLSWLMSFFVGVEMEVTLLGLGDSGKTTYLNVLSTGRFIRQKYPTMGCNIKKIRKGTVTMNIIDIAGHPRFRHTWEIFCQDVNAIVYMVDATDIAVMDKSRRQLHSLLNNPHLAGIPVLVLGNKSDFPGALGELDLSARMKLSMIKDREVCCYSISCKKKKNIDYTLQWLAAHSKSRSG